MPRAKNYDMVYSNTIEVADAMMLREPAGGERSGGKSAESVPRARGPGGNGGKTSVTVCEVLRPRSCAICSHERGLS